MSEKEKKLVEERKFSEIVKIQKKISDLKKLKEYKAQQEIEEKAVERIKKLIEEGLAEREEIQETIEKEKNEIEQLRKEMEEKESLRTSEREEKIDETLYNEYMEKFPKDTPEILDLQKKLEFAIKSKNYAKAAVFEEKVKKLKAENLNRWRTEEREKTRRRLELQKEKDEEKNREKFYSLFIQKQRYLQYLQNKAMDELLQKYRNKGVDLEYPQSSIENAILRARMKAKKINY